MNRIAVIKAHEQLATVCEEAPKYMTVICDGIATPKIVCDSCERLKAELNQAQRERDELKDQLESGELVRVVRCKDCEHEAYCRQVVNLRDNKPDTMPKMLHGFMLGYCSEGELNCGAIMDGEPIKSGNQIQSQEDTKNV